MFLALLCILLWSLFAFKVAIDPFGWLMIVAAGWFCGFMDARFFSRWDQDQGRHTPADHLNPPGDDATLFHP